MNRLEKLRRATPEGMLRASPWLILALLFGAYTGATDPHMIGNVLYQMSKISFAAFLGYWIDRTMFPHGRPVDVVGECVRHARYRRAVIISACIIAMGVGS